MNSDYTDAILEDMNAKFDRLIEVVGNLHDEVRQTAKQEDLSKLQADVKTIKAAVTDTNTQMIDHDRRLTHLESQAR